MTQMTSAVGLTIESGVATIRLARGDAGNAFDAALTDGLLRAATSIAGADDVRCVVIRADGPNFSLGGDVRYFRQHDVEEYGELFGSLIDTVSEALLVFEGLDVPIVAGVHGWVVGAGLALLGVADLVLAAEDARFRTAFTGIGLPGDSGVSWYLTRAVGLRRATALMLENNAFGAAEAADWGLVTQVVPSAELGESLDALASRIASGPTHAFGHVRRNLHHAQGSSLVDQLARERSSTVACAATHDLRNAIDAFANRQIPTFEGR